jgi:hypothetical protein
MCNRLLDQTLPQAFLFGNAGISITVPKLQNGWFEK